MTPPGNFAFLAEHSPLLADLGATAERLFPFDPASCAVKLRLLAEAITQDMAARLGINHVQPTQAKLFRAVDARLGLDPQVRQLFHLLRRTGNVAAHEAGRAIGYREGMEALKVAREVAVWFHRSFGGKPAFKRGPFVLPDDPSQKLLTMTSARWWPNACSLTRFQRRRTTRSNATRSPPRRILRNRRTLMSQRSKSTKTL